jgi:hypothetical protein
LISSRKRAIMTPPGQPLSIGGSRRQEVFTEIHELHLKGLFLAVQIHNGNSASYPLFKIHFYRCGEGLHRLAAAHSRHAEGARKEKNSGKWTTRAHHNKAHLQRALSVRSKTTEPAADTEKGFTPPITSPFKSTVNALPPLSKSAIVPVTVWTELRFSRVISLVNPKPSANCSK